MTFRTVPGQQIGGKMRRHSRVRPILLSALLAVPGLQACYTYQRIQPGEAQPGEDVQLLLRSPAMPAGLSALNGEQLVEGSVEKLTPDSIALSVWIGQAYSETPFERVHHTYSFPLTEVERIQSQRLSRWRTAVTAVGVVAVAVFLVDHIAFIQDPNPSPPPQPPEPPPSPLTGRP